MYIGLVIWHGNEGWFLQELGTMKFCDLSIPDKAANVTIAGVVVIQLQGHGAKPVHQLYELFPTGEEGEHQGLWVGFAAL
jgi:hypothetical protein